MSAKSLAKLKGRRERGGFILIPHAVMDSAAWKQCGGTAIKMLCALARQFNGRNNGDLCAAASVVPGFAPETRTRALRELRHYGLLTLTRQGGLYGPSLYALTWFAIDQCAGKLEVSATRIPPGDWKGDKPRFKPSITKKMPLRNPKRTATDSDELRN